MDQIARTGYFEGDPQKKRLLLKVSDDLRRTIKDDEIVTHMVAINLEDGSVSAQWNSEREIEMFSGQYEDVNPV